MLANTDIKDPSCATASFCSSQNMDPPWTATPCAILLLICFVHVSSQRTTVRLVGGGLSHHFGRLEVYHEGEWGTVCDDYATDLLAKVVCKQLGYDSNMGIVRGSAYYGQGTGKIWMDDVKCNGAELSLDACPFNGWNINNCGHGEDVFVSCTGQLSHQPKVYRGSLQGGTQILIEGSGFSRNQFNHFPGTEHLGNKVYFVNNYHVYPCDVIVEKTDTSRITCSLRPGMGKGTYNVKVTVDGIDVHDNNLSYNYILQLTESSTPTITEISPSSGPPGTMVTLKGRTLTSNYGLNPTAYGSTNEISRVIVGGDMCDLMSPEGKIYGISSGSMTCRLSINGSKIGNINASYTLIPGGSSKADLNLYKVSRNGQIYMFQTYAEIHGVSPSSGSTEGGTMITISGKFFDETRSKAVVNVGGTKCDVLRVDDTTIICRTDREPDLSQELYPGNRGLTVESWKDSYYSRIDLNMIKSLNESSSDYTMYVSDTARITGQGAYYASRLKGFFLPPFDGEYQFIATASEGAELYLSMNSDPQGMKRLASAYGISSQLTLQSNQSYYMEVLFRQRSYSQAVNVAARYLDSKVNHHMAGNVQQEEQEIEITSDVKKELQTIYITDITYVNATYEKQEIVVDGTRDGTFRLGMYSVYTETIRVGALADDVENALQALPVFDESETISVNMSRQGESFKYIVIFKSERGNFPILQWKKIRGTFSVTVSTIREGKPSGRKLGIMISDIPSPLIDSNTSLTQISDSLEHLFTARCPSYWTSPKNFAFHQNMENYSSVPSYMRSYRTDQYQAFCGNWMLRNPPVLFQSESIYLDVHPLFCMAFKGNIVFVEMTVQYSHESGSSEITTSTTLYFNDLIKTSNTEEWNYGCYDLKHAIEEHIPRESSMVLRKLRIGRIGDVLIDDIYFGSDVTTSDTDDTHLRRLVCSPNGYKITDVDVKRYEDSYTVELTPVPGGHGFPLFAVDDTQVPPGTNISIQRLVAASLPLKGTFDLTLRGQTFPSIPVWTGRNDITAIVQRFKDIGFVVVNSHGDNFYTMRWRFNFDTFSGNLEQIQINASSVTGDNIRSFARTITNGQYKIDPLSGEMLQTAHSKPQVTVLINDVSSKCTGSCTFEWLPSSTPVVKNVTRVRETQFWKIQIFGSGFSNTSNNHVTIGGVLCNVTMSTSKTITCYIDHVPSGKHKVVVNVLGSGLAKYADGNVTMVFSALINSINPIMSGLGGSVNLSIVGSGFNTNSSVTVGTKACDIQSVSSNRIVCLVPTTNTSESVSITLEQTGEIPVIAETNFTYNESLTPEVTDISPTSTGVSGGDLLVIVGHGFQTEGNLTLMVGQIEINITFYNDTYIIAELPPCPTGSHYLKVIAGNHGAGLTSKKQLPSITCNLELNNVKPLSGSLFGGTSLTLEGRGFTSDTKVKVGTYECDVTSANVSLIICSIEKTRTTHRVNNHGNHPTFGKYYYWNPQHIKVKVGDVVRWDWDFPFYITTMKPRVEETYNMTTKYGKPGGFSSGDVGTSKGWYSHEFGSAGIFYYWSGVIDEYGTTWFHGSVEVEDQTSFLADVTVTLNGFEATYNLANTTSASDITKCCNASVHKENCSDAFPFDSSDTTKFKFAFWTCRSPVVNRISRQNGTTNDQIGISGNGFSEISGSNDITFGDYICKVSSSSLTSITCTIGSENKPRVGRPQYLVFYVNNMGYAHVNINTDILKTFALFPVVDNISPKNGSRGGYTHLTISGTGFEEGKDNVSTEVNIGGYPCDIVSSSYTEIICLTPRSSNGHRDVSVFIPVPGSTKMPADCATSCQFVYDDQMTPTVTNVTPKTITGENTTSVTITGTGFGEDKTKVSVNMRSSEMQKCLVESVSNSKITCLIKSLPLGQNEVVVDIVRKGRATNKGNVNITSTATILDIIPKQGSVHGGTDVTIIGNGFLSDVSVEVDGFQYSVKYRTVMSLVFTTREHTAGMAVLNIQSNGVKYPERSFNFSEEISPKVSAVYPSSGTYGQNITITGYNLGTRLNETSVFIGDSNCTLTAVNQTDLKCTVGVQRAGTYNIHVSVYGVGNSNADETFTFNMTVNAIKPRSGSLAGDQKVTVLGSGFDSDMVVTICGRMCNMSKRQLADPSQFICDTPSSSDSALQQCDVKIIVNSVTETLENAYTYDPALTPVIDDVTPKRGGTQGGTKLTISGSNFGLSQVTTAGCVSKVTIGGTLCNITKWTNSSIECVTEAHSKSERAGVRLETGCNGKANEVNARFHFVDVWSSVYTWGGAAAGLPTAGDIVVIQKGQTILFDTDSPILKMLIIQGGELVFDEVDVELHAENILITDGGLLQVGTEDNPFEHRATISLHGHQRSKELPIYGTKSLAVREGTLDLHGLHKDITWTKLAHTAEAGDKHLNLQHEVTWRKGDLIVITTTGGVNSQTETEVVTIESVSSDNKTITLGSELANSHLGLSELVAGRRLDFSAEVGLLTRNVVVRGQSDSQWKENIKPCPDGLDPGNLAVQTCNRGRSGGEMGSDQFGAQVIIHTTDPKKQVTRSRIEYVEFYHVGQAFRLGRHPINFYKTGDMSKSYVRGCGIHDTFNRAINIRDTHNLLIERNVIYNVNGVAIFLEDGTETGNVFQYNLGVDVKGSSQLLNSDISPATFWITNPNNTLRHNVAAGGTHFGYWFRLEDSVRSDVTGSYSPQYTPITEFNNNTAHSLGWYGLWIYPKYTPHVMYSYSNSYSYSSTVKAAVIEDMYVWNCRKGIEVNEMGAVHVVGLTAVNNVDAGYEGKIIYEGNLYNDDGPFLKDSMIVGYLSGVPPQGCTTGGVVSPYKFGFSIHNVSFVNFDQSNCSALRVTRIPKRCSYNCGGFTYRTDNLTFVNVDHRIYNDWIWESVYEDMDGSLCGSPSCKVVPCTGTLPSNCTIFSNSSNIPLCNCPADVRLIRFATSSHSYASSSWNLVLTNEYGSTPHHYRHSAIDPSSGWMTNLISGSSYTWSFGDGSVLTNFSYWSYMYRMQLGDYIIISQNLTGEPDKFEVYEYNGYNLIPATNDTLDPEKHYNGDWQYNETSGMITYLISYRDRGHTYHGIQDVRIHFRITKCFFKGCVTPPTLPPSTTETTSYGTPAHIYWSSPTSWPNDTLPLDDDDVTIKRDVWMIADTATPRLNKLVIYGVLEFDHGPINSSYRKFTLSVKDIIIIGGRLLIGSPNDPFLGQMDIILRGRRLGTMDTKDFLPFTQIQVNAKTIAVYGGLEINGKDIGVPWTRLAETGNPGESSITLADNVTWRVGTEIVIGPTSYDMWETEIFRITHVSEDGLTLTLNSSLQFRHIAHKETINGRRINIAAEVGLLTRNIRIYGEDTEPMHHESYGGRILVGATLFNHQLVKGYARFSNVEFIHTGQGKWKSYIKREYSLTYSNAETVTEDKPSSVTKCAFHHGFSSAIDISGTTGLVLSDNVIHHSVSVAIETQSLKTTLQRNLIVLVRVEDSYPGAISGMLSSKLTFINNTVSGTDGVAFNVPGVKCGLSSGPSGNEAHSSSIGLAVFPGNKGHERCNEISNYFIWKCSNMGIYYNNMQSVNIAGNVLAENNIGIYTEVIGPSPVDHLYTWKSCTVKDSLIIGTTSSYNCTTDRAKSSGIINQVDGGHVGMTFASFLGGSNWNPFYGLTRIETYPAIMGVTNIQGVTFAHFKSVCGAKDVMLTTNKWNDDGQHPVVTSKIMKFNSDNDSYFYIHRPNIDKINPRDCVDMDCDGLKKALIKDEDGSFLGEKGAVISQSEWEWDGDPRRGLGDYRIPKEMLTTLNGERINVSTIAPHKGIIRNDHCHYRPAWQAYECHDLDYEMLIIESLDSDTEIRRLSPVAILGDGYLDLINGPQDHSDCSQGYCRKRLSTFMAIVASGNKYSVFFSTTSPQTLRLFLLNSNDSQAVTLEIWYSQSNRRDVYVGEDLVLAKNARMVNEKYIVDRPSVPGEFVPDEKSNDRTGTNFFDRNSNVLYVLLRGSSPVKIVTNPSFIVSFQIPALTPEEFYGEALVHNLALFFDVPPEKIRVVNVVRESGRRKRDADGYKNVVFEISNNPIESANTTANASIPNESLTTEKLLNLSSKFINEVQGGGDIGKMLNLTVRRIAVSEPVVDHGLDAPRLDSAGEINVPKRINISKHLASSYETAPFPIQPCLRVFDVQDEPMSKLGSIADPWRITAHLVSAVHTSAQLHGTTTVNVTSGWANFTDLKLSQFGDGFIIHFNKTHPENEVNLNVISESFDVDKIVVSLRARISTDLSVVNNITKFRVDLLDNATQQRINNITWRGHTWTAMVNLSNALDTTGNMTGLKHTNFNHSTGEAIFNDLAFDQIGIYFLRFHVQSSPEEYDVYGDLRVEVLNEAQISLLNDDTSVTTKISLTFNESFDDVVGEQEEEFGGMVVNRLTENFPDVYFDNVTVKRGSIVVVADMVSTSNNTNAITQSLAEVVEKTQFKYKGKRMKKPKLSKDGKVVKSKENNATPSTSSSSTTVNNKTATYTTTASSTSDKAATYTTTASSTSDKAATYTTTASSTSDKAATYTTTASPTSDKAATYTTTASSTSDKAATYTTTASPTSDKAATYTTTASSTSDKAATYTTTASSTSDKAATYTTTASPTSDKAATYTTTASSTSDKAATYTTTASSTSDKAATYTTTASSTSDKAATYTTTASSTSDKAATQTTSSPESERISFPVVIVIVVTPVVVLFGIIFMVIVCKCWKIRKQELSEHLTKTSVGSDDCTTRTGENNWRRYESLTHVESGNEMKPRQLIPRLQTTGDIRISTPTFESENQMPSSMVGSMAYNNRLYQLSASDKPHWISNDTLSSLTYYIGKRK